MVWVFSERVLCDRRALVELCKFVLSVSRGTPWTSRYRRKCGFHVGRFSGPNWPNPVVFFLQVVVSHLGRDLKLNSDTGLFLALLGGGGAD